MMVAALQAILTIISGAGLFLLWRRFAREGVGVRIVAAGFVVRCLLSSALFWISWLRLPFGRSLQLGDGLWFFGLDGKGYYLLAEQLVAQHLLGFLVPDRTMAASTWVQVLAAGRVSLGESVAVAALINVACFLGGAVLVARWAHDSGAVDRARLTLGALSFGPALILWATQPLKDTFFILVFIAFLYAFHGWAESESVEGSGRRWRNGLSLVIVLFLVAGVRWYYGVILWGAFSAVSLWLLICRKEWRRHFRGVSTAWAGMGFVLALTTPWSIARGLLALVRIPSWAVGVLQTSKSGFETGYDASTVVSGGAAIQWLPQADVLARIIMAFVPRSIAVHLGIASVGGGRGLWTFAEVDTVFFATVVVLVVLSIRRSRPIHPLQKPELLLVGLTLLAGLVMFYVVNNFGTLLRLRLMLLVPISLLPLTIVNRAGRNEDGSERLRADPLESDESE